MRIHKIKNNYGMADYYKYHKTNYNTKIDSGLFNKIVADFNGELQTLIIEKGLIYMFPSIQMELMLKKAKVKPRIEEGKLVNNLPIDWQATNKLWERNSEAREKKLLIRFSNSHTSSYVFRIFCKKFKSTLKLRPFYKFTPARGFRRYLGKVLKDPNKEIDAYLLY